MARCACAQSFKRGGVVAKLGSSEPLSPRGLRFVGFDSRLEPLLYSEVRVSDAYRYFQQGQQHLRDGLSAQATVALEKAKRVEPSKSSIREALGIAYYRIQRFSEAEHEFRAVLELAPTNHYAHFVLGRCLEQRREYSEARRHYKLAVSLHPRNDDYVEALERLEARTSANEGH